MFTKQHYNTGKAIDRNELKRLIEDAKENEDWSRVESANISKITDMSHLFESVENIENLNLDGWDTSNVINMRSMFRESKYNHPLHFDTLNVKSMYAMFYGSKYNHPLNFDTSKVENMMSMFRESNYNRPLHFDTSNVIDMYAMFYGSKYNHPLNFDMSNVEDVKNIFYGAAITSLITFKGGNIPDNVQAFIDETNIAYEEKCKIENAVQSDNVVVQRLKL